MAQIDSSQFTRPITTGAPAPAGQGQRAAQTQQESAVPFLDVLRRKLEVGTGIAFSKHAVSRVAERQIDVSDKSLARLDEGMRLAQEKGLRDALILIDDNAYIVNATAGKVITVDGEASKGSVYTNIDGTVIA